jgi:hypothetical protein
VTRTFRSPAYLLSLAVLVGVTAVSLALTRAGSGASVPPPSVVQPTATAPASPTPMLPAESPADVRRRADLAALADLLETYRSRNGSYPSTQDYFNTVCTQAFDAGCLLTAVSKQLPVTDGTHPYWYRSDGASYTLFAYADAESAQDGCPAALPPALVSGPVICLNSGGGR